MKAQWDEGGRRILLGDDTGGGRHHNVAGQVPVYWSSDFNCTLFYIHKYVADNIHSQFRHAQIWICAGTSGRQLLHSRRSVCVPLLQAYKFRPTLFILVLPRVNPLKPELNPICYLLALGAHHFLHVSRIRVKLLTFRLLMSYIYIWSTHS